MKQYNQNNDWVLVLEKGEPLIATLTQFSKLNNVTAGFFHGLGGALSAEIGYYHLDRQEYEFRVLDEVLEIVSLHGNIATTASEPIIHAHGVLSDADLRTYGGHIKEVVTGGTIEIQLEVMDGEWQRKLDATTGLKLMSFDAG